MLNFRDTISEDLEEIKRLETDNEHWICTYSRERHLQCIAGAGERHISVFREDDDKLIGFIILRGLDKPDKALEFRRIVLGDKGSGYGRLCIQWVKCYCFEELQYHRLWLDVFTDNKRALHLYESEGFKREGALRENMLINARYRSIFVLSILEEEYFSDKIDRKLLKKIER